MALAITSALYAQEPKEECRGIAKFQNVADQLGAKAPEKAEPSVCLSLATVFDRITNNRRGAGKRLEADEPLDASAAQAELDEALKVDSIRTRIEEMRQAQPNVNSQRLYEAALLDAEGYYAARDLIISKLVESTK
jgi:hypothetical protein